MANFNSGKNLAIVLQLQQANEKEVLALLEQNPSSIFGRGRYAYILHDKDVLDTGEIKGKHIHIVFNAETAKSSANWIKHFSEQLKVEPEAVSVEMQGSEKKCVRYLLHLDDGAKHQYDRSEVITNMDDVCRKAWEASSGFVQSPTLEQLTEAYKGGAKALYNLVGMSSFAKAKRVCEEIGLENEYVSTQTKELQLLYNTLCGVTANPEYLKKGYVPLKDFQEILEACSDTLKNLIDYQRKMREKLEKDEREKGRIKR